MKDLVRYSGILIMLAGVILLVIIVSEGVMKNTGLTLSACLVILGMVVYILVSRKLD